MKAKVMQPVFWLQHKLSCLNKVNLFEILGFLYCIKLYISSKLIDSYFLDVCHFLYDNFD